MPDCITINLWTAIIQATTIVFSSLCIVLQRFFRSPPTGPLKEDKVRDSVNVPFSNGNRVSRIISETFVLTMLSAYLCMSHVSHHISNIYTVIGSVITFFTWIYCLVLAITASRFPLPDGVGWIFNVHLCILYSILFCSSFLNLAVVLWDNAVISFIQSLPFALPVIISFDLVYTTITVNNGSPFIDENEKTVIGCNVESIAGRLYFTWITPLINLINTPGYKLSDDNLPTLPVSHRSYNMFCIFGQSRGKKLIKRIYLGNQYSLITQVVLGSIFPVLYYATPFFLNRLLLVIEEINSGKNDSSLYIRGLGHVCSLSLFIIINSLVLGQLWFYGIYYCGVKFCD